MSRQPAARVIAHLRSCLLATSRRQYLPALAHWPQMGSISSPDEMVSLLSHYFIQVGHGKRAYILLFASGRSRCEGSFSPERQLEAPFLPCYRLVSAALCAIGNHSRKTCRNLLAVFLDRGIALTREQRRSTGPRRRCVSGKCCRAACGHHQDLTSRIRLHHHSSRFHLLERRKCFISLKRQ